VCSYRGVITFSRGGVFVGLFMIFLLLIIVFPKVNIRAKSKIALSIIVGVFLGSFVWAYISVQTGGMIDKSYANQNATGVKKESVMTVRETLIETECKLILDTPIMMVGVGINRDERL